MVMLHKDFLEKMRTTTEMRAPTYIHNAASTIATGDWNIDRINAALSDHDWHLNLLSFVGSLVKKQLPDQVILLMAEALTLPGYTVDQTKVEMQKMIDGARKKGFDQADEIQLNPHTLFDHVLDIDLTPPKWLIQDILADYSLAALVAPSYHGKSYLAVDIACSVASGHSFHGLDVEPGRVFYIVGEGRFGIRRRVQAWCMDRGVSLSRDFKLHFSKQGLNLRDSASLQAIRSELRQANGVSLIIVDTLARSFGAGNENSPQDMGEFIQACDDLMHEFGATVLIVHHTGKDSTAGPRGHSALFGALDTVMSMKKIGDTDVQLICDKQKDAREFERMQFCFVTLGGEDDTPILQLVPTALRNNAPRLGKNEQLAMDTFYEATNGRPSQCRLHLENWRSIFLKRHTGDTDKAKNDAFSRARRELVSKDFLKADNDYYTLGDKATFGDKQENVARQNHSEGDATDTPF